MKEGSVLLSICIPAYRRPDNIKRLLDSIVIQNFSDFEIIVSDDSPDDSVFNIISNYKLLPIHYIKNEKPLGTPANWNKAISLAKGEWIKIMHDDDWFYSPNALNKFLDATKGGDKFIFCRYYNVFTNNKREEPIIPVYFKRNIIKEPMLLLARNIIGPPSVTFLHRSIREQYDEQLKWRVDMEYYIRLLKTEKNVKLVDEPLINVGISESQVTNYCIDQPEVELPEGFRLLEKHGVKPLQHILVYDAWWRIIRNTGIRTVIELKSYSGKKEWPIAIVNMVRHQTNLSPGLLRNGAISKTFMLLSYILNKKNLTDY